MEVAADIIRYLKDEGFTNPMFVNQEQDDAGFPVVTITRTGGTANPKWARDDIAVQIRVKGERYQHQAAEQLIYDIRDELLGIHIIAPDGADYEYVRFILQGDVGYVGTDDNNRPIFTSNYIITADWKEPVGNREPIK